ncbi:flagellar biosynthesis anti-sigma factor FlgM [Paucibacter sp. R3-3]|uniref:Negative regulator of flagellin synthesis n=1 Tax=Roseateles agri TaxID=3098619 RepID=A0ABU5DT56_9BURK|nr:flagellar biosynthesis anti-sigma factor FlgM [Paucibacter sp. R3-3]MDY0748347.1 flagellar biosynthesis anti-sigma factor FlgM [Paucibacter sp. R3-3]
MKIGTSHESAAAAVNAEKPASAKAGRSAGATGATATASTPAEPEASAQLELSPTATSLMAASDDGSFDAAKVARISQAIADGKFTINADAIAGKMISNAQELLSRGNSSH